jgi:4-hydroxy-tetrahydrodipicolinate synthase
LETALVTPFRKDGSIDEAAIRRLARRQIDGGAHFLSPVGTTGEAPTLSQGEKLRVIELVVEESAGSVPVLAGAGGYDTHETITLARDIEKIGADGILSVTPYYNKPTQEGLYQHYKANRRVHTLPIVLYNVPGRTGVNMEAATTVRLSAIANIVGVKEASGNVVQAAEIVASAAMTSSSSAVTMPLRCRLWRSAAVASFALRPTSRRPRCRRSSSSPRRAITLRPVGCSAGCCRSCR